MRISVVVPAYDEEEFLPRCLKSLRNQDYAGQYEIIVVDNGSLDSTVAIASNCGVGLVGCSRKGVVYAREPGLTPPFGDINIWANAELTVESQP